jgi:hypothetical protein
MLFDEISLLNESIALDKCANNFVMILNKFIKVIFKISHNIKAV